MTEPSIPKKRTTIYIEPNLLKKFKEICTREQESMSQNIESYMARIVTVHDKGNPQLRLERFIGKVNQTCYRCKGHFSNLVKVKYVSGLVADTCPECLEYARERKLVKKVLGAT